MSAFLSIGEAAKRLGLSVDTVRELEKGGELKAMRTPGGHRRFKPEALDAYASRRSGTRSMRRAEREAPPQPARRRNRMQRAEDEPPDLPPPDGWDEEPFEPPAPAPARPVPKSQGEELLAEFRDTTAWFVEESRLRGLRSDGLAQLPWNASASARSAVTEMLAEYVNARRFPASMPHWEARQAVQAKVGAVMEPFNVEAARQAEQKAKADARRTEEQQQERRLGSLVERGKSRALTKTLGWEYEDAQEARADVARALKDEVESDWTDREVDDLVDEVLDEWEEDDE